MTRPLTIPPAVPKPDPVYPIRSTFLVSLPSTLVERLHGERKRRGLDSLSETIAVLLDEGIQP